MTIPQNFSKLGNDPVMILYSFVGGTLANSADTRCYGPLPAHAGYTPTTRAITRCRNVRGGALERCSHAAGILAHLGCLCGQLTTRREGVGDGHFSARLPAYPLFLLKKLKFS